MGTGAQDHLPRWVLEHSTTCLGGYWLLATWWEKLTLSLDMFSWPKLPLPSQQPGICFMKYYLSRSSAHLPQSKTQPVSPAFGRKGSSGVPALSPLQLLRAVQSLWNKDGIEACLLVTSLQETHNRGSGVSVARSGLLTTACHCQPD